MSLEQDLEEALNEIGWQHARLISPSLFFPSLPNKLGGLLFKSKAEADRSKNALNGIITAMKTFKAAERRLTEQQRSTINSAIAQPEEYETGKFDNRLAKVDEALNAIVPGVIEAKEQMEQEVKRYWSSPNRTRIHKAYLIAEQIAEIHVFGLGKRPTYGTNDGRPSTPFCRAVKRVFDLLGIEKGFMEPCKAATKNLTDKRLARLLERRAALLEQMQKGHLFRWTP